MDKAFSALAASQPLSNLGLGWADHDTAVQWCAACAACLAAADLSHPVFSKLPHVKGSYVEHAANRLAMTWGL